MQKSDHRLGSSGPRRDAQAQGARRRRRILGFALSCSDLPVANQLDQASRLNWVISLSEGRCDLRRDIARAAEALVLSGAGATGSGRPRACRTGKASGVSERMHAKTASAHLTPFPILNPRFVQATTRRPLQTGDGGLSCARKTPVEVSDDAMPRLCTCVMMLRCLARACNYILRHKRGCPHYFDVAQRLS